MGLLGVYYRCGGILQVYEGCIRDVLRVRWGCIRGALGVYWGRIRVYEGASGCIRGVLLPGPTTSSTAMEVVRCMAPVDLEVVACLVMRREDVFCLFSKPG